MTDETYNGWTNHATWCVHLHLTNTETTQRVCEFYAKRSQEEAPSMSQVTDGIWTAENAARYRLADQLKDQVYNDVVETWKHDDHWTDLLRLDLVTAYLEKVDWNAIAVAFLEESCPAPSTG